MNLLLRGVSNITAVDQNRHCCKFHTKNATEHGLTYNSIQSESFIFEKKATVMILFLQIPPYDWKQKHYLSLLLAQKIIKNQDHIIFEHSKFT